MSLEVNESQDVNEFQDNDVTMPEATGSSNCDVPVDVTAHLMEEYVPNMDIASSLIPNNVNLELLAKVQNLTNTFSETVIPVQRQNEEMRQYIDEANAYIDSLEDKIKKLEDENRELKSCLQNQ